MNSELLPFENHYFLPRLKAHAFYKLTLHHSHGNSPAAGEEGVNGARGGQWPSKARAAGMISSERYRDSSRESRVYTLQSDCETDKLRYASWQDRRRQGRQKILLEEDYFKTGRAGRRVKTNKK